jgi:hypothetical protein
VSNHRARATLGNLAVWVTGLLALLAGTGLATAVTTVMQNAAVQVPAPEPRLSTQVAAAVNSPPTPIDVVLNQPRTPLAAGPVAAKPAPAGTGPAPAAAPVRRAARPVIAALVDAATSCTGAGWQQRRGQAALGSLRHPVPGGVTVAFQPGGGALKGMTYYDRHHVDVFVASCARESDALLRHVVAHEMGHAWDSRHMTDALRADYLAARGIPAGTPWFGCSRCQDFATPAGDFAETYAQWQRGASDSRSRLAAPATPAELQRLGAAFFS